MILEILLIIIILILCYSIFNLLRKQSKYERLFNEYESRSEKIIKDITTTINKMNEVDSKGAFKSDDEVGFIWENLKELINKLKINISESLPGVYYEEGE